MNVDLGNATIGGEYKIVLKNEVGDITQETGWNKNLLTDTFFSNPSVFSGMYAFVGTGTTAPTNSDTKLASILGSASSVASGSGSNSVEGNAVDGYVLTTSPKIFRWNLGAITGNVSEWGWAASSSASTYILAVRNLIKDTEGMPTTITVTSSDQLEIWWRLKKKWPGSSGMSNVVQSKVINGVATDVTCKNLNPSLFSDEINFDSQIKSSVLGKASIFTATAVGASTTAVLSANSGDVLSGSLANITYEQSALNTTATHSIVEGGAKYTHTASFPLLTGAPTLPMQFIALLNRQNAILVPSTIASVLTFSPQFTKGADKILTVSFSYTVTRAP